MEANLEFELNEILAKGPPASPMRLFNEVCGELANHDVCTKQETPTSFYNIIPDNKTLEDIPLAQRSDAFLPEGFSQENHTFPKAFVNTFLPSIVTNDTAKNAAAFPTMETLLENGKETTKTYANLVNVPKGSVVFPLEPPPSTEQEKLVMQEQIKRDRLIKAERSNIKKQESKRNKSFTTGRKLIFLFI